MTAQQLKNSILQMAVQGKLVPQDPNDEPASVLLQRIKAEKEELIKAGKIKKDKKSSEICRGATHNLPYAYCEQIGKEIRDISDEIPFDIPDSWEWCRLSSILNKLTDGTHSTPKYVEKGVPFISVKDVSSGKLDFSKCKYITETEHKLLFERCNPELNDILLTKVGTTGIPVIVDTEDEFSLFVSVALLKFNQDFIYNKYLVHLINSPLVQIQATENTKGVGNKNWVMRDIANTLIVIPPLSEQKRIVSKIEELLPYIEAYEKAETQLTALNTLFPDMLKKSILQEAVQGKLVPQNPDDEPASVLLERIKAEKHKLVKEGKIKKEKPLAPITEEEIPFDIPESWEWCRIGSIFNTSSGSTPLKSESQYWEKGIHNWVRTTDLNNGILSKCEIKISQKALDECNLKIIPLNSVCIAMYGGAGTIGKNALININTTINQSVCAIHPNGVCDMKYVLYFFQYYRRFWMEYASGSRKDPNINKVIINNTLFPLPPLTEQKRIVAKIEEIMPFIGNLAK